MAEVVEWVTSDVGNIVLGAFLALAGTIVVNRMEARRKTRLQVLHDILPKLQEELSPPKGIIDPHPMGRLARELKYHSLQLSIAEQYLAENIYAAEHKRWSLVGFFPQPSTSPAGVLDKEFKLRLAMIADAEALEKLVRKKLTTHLRRVITAIRWRNL